MPSLFKGHVGSKKHLLETGFFWLLPGLNKKGFGILEVLVASVIMGTILIGAAETFKVALQAQAISGNTIAENDLKVAFSKSVQMDNCAETLRPLNLAGTDDNLKNRGIGKFKDNVPLAGELKSSGLFKDRLQVVKVELKGTEPTHETEPLTPPWTEPKDREYTIYYKKTGMGSLNTMGGGTCSASDVSGCYSYSCQVEYERQSASEMSCQAQDCSDLSQVIMSQVQSSITSQIANKKCADNKYFIGFDNNGDPICSAEIHCEAGKALRVYEEGGVKKAECLDVGGVSPGTCTEPGEVMTRDRFQRRYYMRFSLWWGWATNVRKSALQLCLQWNNENSNKGLSSQSNL